MKLNKRKLAALAMSAVMAASTMPAVTFAAENTETGAAEIAVSDAAAEVIDVVVDENGKVTITYNDGKTATAAATKKTLTEANCTTPKRIMWTYTLSGKEYASNAVDEGEALGHNYKTLKVVDKYPTCSDTGLGHDEEKCDRCGDVKQSGQKYTIAATGHKKGELQVRYTNPVNVVEVNDGTFELKDKTQDGSYVKETYYKCATCGVEVVENSETIKIPASAAVEEYREVSRVEGIENLVAGTPEKDIPADEKLELENCDKTGTYWVGSYDKNDNLISETKHSVAPHHVSAVTFKTKLADDNSLVAVYNKDKVQTGYKNVSCCKEANYYVITTCSVCGKELSKEERTAKPEGAHVVNDAGKKAVDDAKADAKANDGVLSKAGYEELEKTAKDKNNGIVLTTPDACEKEGTVTITYLCKVCGKETSETVTLKVAKLGHVEAAAVEENKVEATCDKEGSKDAVVYCSRCHKEISRKKVTIPKLGHAEAKASDYGVKFAGKVVVDDAYGDAIKKGAIYHDDEMIGYYRDYSVVAKPFYTCEKCGTDVAYNDANAETKVVDVVKEDGKGNAGKITLNTTYTVYDKVNKKNVTITSGDVTFNYFSNMTAYMERNPEKDPLNGLNKDEDGVWRYYVDDEFQKDYVGIVEYNGGEFFVANGVVCTEANGLNQNKDGRWYFLSHGQIQRSVTGLAMYNGAWFYLKNGELDKTVHGLVDYDGGTFLFAAGRLCREVHGLWRDFDGTWYFLALGQVQAQHTGVAGYDGAFFYVVNGKLATDYNGTVMYDGKEFKVIGGQLY